MKKNKIIKLTENDLVRIIQRVILENEGTPTSPTELRNQVTGLTGSEVVMYNESGLNRYESGEKGIFKGKRTAETYKINQAWVSLINNQPTLSFNVTRLDDEHGGVVQDKAGLMKGAFTRKEKRVTETYLVEALSVTEAEAKVIQDFKGYTFDFEVKSVGASKIIKIIE